MKSVNEQAIELAIGRILSIASRPFQDGDYEQYDKCRAVVMEAAAELAEEANGN